MREANAELTKSNETLKRKLADELESMKQQSEDERVTKSDLIKDLEQKLKMSEEQYEMSKQKWDKDLAIFKQKQEFLDLQLKEERLKNEEQRQSHD